MINVFFTAATSYDGDLNDIKLTIINLIEEHQANILSGKQIVDKKLLTKDKNLGKEAIFKREHQYIAEADCVVAEVTKPSLGVGSQITFAIANKKPVLALIHEDFSEKLSPIIAGNPAENLYIEYYNADNLSLKIKHFLRFIQASKNRKGKLIVIDGGDGSGKETQVNLLADYLKKKDKHYKIIDFPRYYSSFHGKTVAKFLRGEFGTLDQVSPYLSSLAYALDRASMKEEIELSLEKGDIVLANRYATSSLAHQSARVPNKKERTLFLRWLYELEYNVHRIPKENIVIYLYVPWKIGLELTNKKARREYLNGKDDILEKDIKNRQNTENMYLELAKQYKHWVTINCVEDGVLLSKQRIHEKIVSVLSEKGVI